MDTWEVLDRFGFALFQYFAAVVWQSAILFAAVGLLAMALRRHAPRLRQALWMGALLLTPLLPLLSSLLSASGAPQARVALLPAYEAREPRETPVAVISPSALPLALDPTDLTDLTDLAVSHDLSDQSDWSAPAPRAITGLPTPSTPSTGSTGSTGSTAAPPASAPAASAAVASHESGYPWALALLAYTAGLAAFLAWTLLGHWRIHRWIRRGSASHAVRGTGFAPETTAQATASLHALGSGATPVPVSAKQALLLSEHVAEAATALGLRRVPRAVLSDDIPGPLTAGLFRPTILLPTSLLASLSPDDLRAIALHETAHVKHHDPLLFAVAALLRAVFFFHPLLWLASRQISQLAEHAADDAVLAATGEPLHYAKLLTTLAEQLPAHTPLTHSAAGVLLSRSAFLRRIEIILSEKRRLRRLTRLALATVLLVFAASLLAVLAVPLSAQEEGMEEQAEELDLGGPVEAIAEEPESVVAPTVVPEAEAAPAADPAPDAGDGRAWAHLLEVLTRVRPADPVLDPVAAISKEWGAVDPRVKPRFLSEFIYGRGWLWQDPPPEFPDTLEIVHLAVSDPDLEIRNAGLELIDNVYLRDFTGNPESYEDWYEATRDRPYREVIVESAQALAQEAVSADSFGREMIAQRLSSLMYLRSGPLWDEMQPQLRQALLKAGLPEILVGWLNLPETSELVREYIWIALRDMHPEDEFLAAHIYPLVIPDWSPDWPLASDVERELSERATMLLQGYPAWGFRLAMDFAPYITDTERVRAWADLMERFRAQGIPALLALSTKEYALDAEAANAISDALSNLTDVPYDPSHDAAWWARWWETNQYKYPEDVRNQAPPKLPDALPATAAPAPEAMPSGEPGAEHLSLNKEELVQELYTRYSELTQIEAKMYLDAAGNVIGVTADNIGQAPLAQKLGLQDGDVLQSVNGEQIDSEQKILELVQKYANASSFTIHILRNGQPKIFTYTWNGSPDEGSPGDAITDPRESAATLSPLDAPAVESAGLDAETMITVPAIAEEDAEWVSAGMVIAGTVVRLRATGEVQWHSERAEVGPNGTGAVPGEAEGDPFQYLAPDAPCGALLGKVGEDGEPFLIGEQFEGALQESGELYFAVNDCRGYFLDNTGAFAVTVEVLERPWGPEQAIGQPNTPENGPFETSWASATTDGQVEWLQLEYALPVRPIAIQVHESNNPGALFKVSYFDSEGLEHPAWEGRDPSSGQSGRAVSEVEVAVPVRISSIRLYLNSPAVPGRNTIDAVALFDEEGQIHWAIRATASSSYEKQIGTRWRNAPPARKPQESAERQDFAELSDFETTDYRDAEGNVIGVTVENLGEVPLAQQLGLLDGDVLLTLNDEEIHDAQKFVELAQKYQGAESLRVGILREGERRVITCTFENGTKGNEKPSEELEGKPESHFVSIEHVMPMDWYDREIKYIIKDEQPRQREQTLAARDPRLTPEQRAAGTKLHIGAFSYVGEGTLEIHVDGEHWWTYRLTPEGTVEFQGPTEAVATEISAARVDDSDAVNGGGS